MTSRFEQQGGASRGPIPQLSEVVPWGRSLAEYRRMFALTDTDLRGRILGCGDGPASFNAEMHRNGSPVVSVDPMYRFSADEIGSRIAEVYDGIVESAQANRDAFVWKEIPSPEEMGRRRQRAMEVCLADFPSGKREGRYRVESLPSLSFTDCEFDLALCSHFLFTYSHLFDADFHIQCVLEMLRVAGEARVFPLLNHDGTESPHVGPVMSALGERGYTAAIERVDYEFQKGGHSMLRAGRR